ncbi:acetoacetate decarboxylase family protein [Halopelagius longus]|uniref:Acetoacetate decarboxylase n=1 Tax=Halopelagius longus TaxID=1236180 RepID=A0A1H0Z909_9EURY|nr:acetoacetate decarboxylase family protein [Halopelagius longus]RDI72879.1 acetoacetate decarboxylase [Halopelagius longus]SDQ23631.1 Acetoacetate decarboxylase (ADC) [Halopelagius longus]
MTHPNSPTGGSGDGPGERSVTLSTGETVSLPLSTEGTFLGAVFSARRDGVGALLPAGLEPIRVAPRRAAVTFLSASYRRVGDGTIAPYDEFAVVVPAVHDPTAVPVASLLRRGASGYVWFLPVTTDPARALGTDVWGFPKVVADVTHEDDASRRRTTVSADGERVLAFEVKRPRAIRRRESGYAYSVAGGRLLRAPVDVDGDVGIWPYTGAASVEFGDHPRARRLRSLDIGRRALARFAVDGEVVFAAGDPVEPTR